MNNEEKFKETLDDLGGSFEVGGSGFDCTGIRKYDADNKYKYTYEYIYGPVIIYATLEFDVEEVDNTEAYEEDKENLSEQEFENLYGADYVPESDYYIRDPTYTITFYDRINNKVLSERKETYPDIDDIASSAWDLTMFYPDTNLTSDVVDEINEKIEYLLEETGDIIGLYFGY